MGPAVQMPFAISIIRHFPAGHQLRMYDGSLEPLHEHDWVVKVTVSAAELDEIGVVMDFHELERRLDELIAPLWDRSLNDVPAFAQVNPSAEQVARHIARGLRLAEGVSLSEVEIWETPENSASYRP
jgi:6-pyruvoyltetrahydropterin/6-carboxytetrahydropterin synthase